MILLSWLLVHLYTPHKEVEGVYWNCLGCPSVHLSVRGHNFVQSFFSYSFAHTALKFIHNVYVHMKVSMCNFHDHTMIGCGIMFPWNYKFYWIFVVQRNNPTVLHVLNSKLHTILLVVYSSACTMFITILSLVAELSPLELVNFTKSFRLVQIGTNCRRHFKMHLKWKISAEG